MVCSGGFIRQPTGQMAAQIRLYILPHYRKLTQSHESNILSFWRLPWYREAVVASHDRDWRGPLLYLSAVV
jgi:hypothetical protein